MNLQNIQSIASKGLGRASILLKKNSPQILLGAGIVGVVASAVLACKATLNAEKAIQASKDDIDIIKLGKAEGDYSDERYLREMTTAYVQSGMRFAKLYGPSVGLGALSIGCILGAHGILSKRNVGLIAAYNLVSEGYNNYRLRVIEKYGDEVDRDFRLGLEDKEVIDENGRTKKIKVGISDDGEVMLQRSVYAKFFDEASPQWRTDPTMNLFFLRAQQNYANDKLKMNGHVFLNEVYDALGIPRTKAGAVVGWVYDENHEGDNYIDFDIYNPENEPGRDFVNGYNRSILLDFNVDGVIYDLI